jgi:hypothetical protein
VSQTPGKLERRARALLRAYPAEYRSGRAEEIIGTLLEAAPPGRSFPAAREAWSLVAGGRHARAARNRCPGVTASVRLALLLGLSVCLSDNMSVVFGLPFAGKVLGSRPGDGVPWLAGTMLALGLALALAPWLGSRAATTALAVPAGALAVYEELSAAPGIRSQLPLLLIVMAALAALSGGPVRLPRSWLWLPCAIPLALAAGDLLLSTGQPIGPGLAAFLEVSTWLLLAAVAACWLVTDARPAFGLCVVRLLIVLFGSLSKLAYPGSPSLNSLIVSFLLNSTVLLPISLLAARLLFRREKTPGPLPYPEP